MQKRLMLHYNIIIHNFPTHKHTKYNLYKIFNYICDSIIVYVNYSIKNI